MDTLTITITNTRTIDGLIFAANSAKKTPEAYAEFLLTQDGKRYADANSYGVVTSAAFFARFTPTEYANILAASADTTEVPAPVGGVPTTEEQQAYDDAVAAFQALESPSEGDIATYQAAVDAYAAAQTPDNQADIDAAIQQNADAAEVKALLDELTSEARVAFDDPRVSPGLDLLVARALIAAERPAEIVAYDRPFAEVAEEV
jgi:hypothetical protein